MSDEAFTPALGYASLTPLYDLAIRLLTRERIWRGRLLEQVAPHDGESILDVGCGTGTFALAIKRKAPGARVVGMDPDSQVLARARSKASAAGLDIEWREGFAHDVAGFAGEFDKAVSSLVFHQVPLDEKFVGLAAMWASVNEGGEVHIADYCLQHEWPMRQLFRLVQALDGWTNTQANVDGVMEEFLVQLSGSAVVPRAVVNTPTGAISLLKICKERTA
jgi:ubiquinone/menaquinone biosynthesis C-methylase UbiE